jgi:hypothetical protein
MYPLHIEEFEPRYLLNGGGFFAGPLLSQPFAAETVVLSVTGHTLLIAIIPHAGPFGWDGPGDDGLELGQFRNLSHPGFDSKDPPGMGPRGPEHPDGEFGRSPGGDVSAPWGPADQADAVPDTSSMVYARGYSSGKLPPGSVVAANGASAEAFMVGSGTSTLSPRAPVENQFGASPGPNGVSAEAFFARLGQSSVSPRPFVENLLGGQGLPATVLSAVPFAGLGSRAKELDSGFAENPQHQRQTDSGQSAMPAIPGAVEDAVLPSPRVSGALAVLPSFNLSALGQGLVRFLDGLEKMGGRLTRKESASVWWPWIVAVAAAATACEITRRELRRLTWNGESGEWNALRLFTRSTQRPAPDNEDRS